MSGETFGVGGLMEAAGAAYSAFQLSALQEAWDDAAEERRRVEKAQDDLHTYLQSTTATGLDLSKLASLMRKIAERQSDLDAAQNRAIRAELRNGVGNLAVAAGVVLSQGTDGSIGYMGEGGWVPVLAGAAAGFVASRALGDGDRGRRRRRDDDE